LLASSFIHPYLHRDWGDIGRAAIASFKEVEDIVTSYVVAGNTLTEDEMMQELKRRCPESAPPSQRTCRNYMTMAAAVLPKEEDA
jgi:hypothetical protein